MRECERAGEGRRREKIREEVKVGLHVEVCGDEQLVEHRGGESGSLQEDECLVWVIALEFSWKRSKCSSAQNVCSASANSSKM